MNIPVIFQFLKEVSANNNREWFNAHKDLYEEARGEFENLLSAIITRISLFDESIRGVQVKDCTYRFIVIRAFRRTRPRIKLIWADTSTPAVRNQTTAVTMFTLNRATACWQVVAIVCLLRR